MSLKHCIKAYTSFLMQLEVKEKNLQHFFMKMGNGQKTNFLLFEAKSLGLFKCISPLIKYYMFNEKCHFESSWIVWLKDMAVALMRGTVCDHEEVKNGIVARTPLIWPAIILSTEFTIAFPFVLPSQIKTLDTVMYGGGVIDVSEHVAFYTAWCLFHTYHPMFKTAWSTTGWQRVYKTNWTALC